MSKKRIHILSIILITVLLFVAYGFWRAFAGQAVIFQGQMEAHETDVAAKVTARVGAVLVREGDKITAGSLILQLDSPEVKAKLKQAESAQLAAQAQVNKVYSGARDEERAMAKLSWQAKKAGADLANDTYQRINNLFDKGLVSAQKRDEALASLKSQQSAANAAYEQYRLALKGARDEDKAAIDANAAQVAAVLDEVKAAQEEVELTSPVGGEVVRVLAKVGEILPQGVPAITVVDLDDQWAVFNVQEIYLKDFKVSSRFSAKIPALDLTGVEFEVYYLSALPDFATWRSARLGHDFDMRTYEVRARPLQPIADLRPGMTVVIE